LAAFSDGRFKYLGWVKLRKENERIPFPKYSLFWRFLNDPHNSSEIVPSAASSSLANSAFFLSISSTVPLNQQFHFHCDINFLLHGATYSSSTEAANGNPKVSKDSIKFYHQRLLQLLLSESLE